MRNNFFRFADSLRRHKIIYGSLLLSFIVFSASARSACPPSLSWSQPYNGQNSMDDVAYAVATDLNGNVIVAGSEVTDPNPTNRWLVKKFNASGTLLWSRGYTWTGNASDYARAVAVDSSGNIVVAGYLWDAPNPGAYFWLVGMYDKDGNGLWNDAPTPPTPIGSGDISRAYGVAVDGSGNTVAVGTELRGGGTDWRIRKYDSAGVALWTQTYNGPGNLEDTAYGVAIDSNGNAIVVGNQCNGGLNYDWVIQKYNPNGGLIWQQTYDGPANGWDEAYAVAVDKSDNIVVVGKEWTGNVSGERYNWVIRKYDSVGKLIWSDTDNGALNMDDKAYAVAIDGCGNIVVGGYHDGDATQTQPPYDAGYWHIHQYDPDGNLLCSFAYNGPGNGPEGAYGTAIDGNGDFILAGFESRDDLGQGINWLVRKYVGLGCSVPPPLPPLPPPQQLPRELIESGKVKIVGGIRGYINPKRGEQATILVRPTGAGEIRVRIYDEEGTLVKEITTSTSGGQTEVLQWNGTDSTGAPVTPGLYPILIQGPGINYRDTLVVIR